MNNIQILDCTLRDGGYINNWEFGEKIIKKILKRLTEANVDIIECGFLSETEYDVEKTIFSKVAQLDKLLPKNRNSKYVAMIALGEKEISYEKIPMCDGQSITGIRLTFHKHEIERAFGFAEDLMRKGYHVFIQPVGTCTYSDKELLELVEKVNILHPYAFYIVDTLGTITGIELLRLFQLTDNNLDKGIKIGFHSHNNLQLSFSNSQELIKIFTERDIIIDSSVMGMGRGAGNLCTELLAQYMNEHLYTHYDVTNILEIADNYLMRIKENSPWGYTIPYYIAAVRKCHPNYATYLMNLQTLTVKDIEFIMGSIPKDKRALYDKECVKELYNQYLAHYVDDSEAIKELRTLWKNKTILALAPGKSLIEEQDKINTYIEEEKPYIITVNFITEMYNEDMLFISNLKRFENLETAFENVNGKKVIVTSNIEGDINDSVFKINYADYLNNDDFVSDNAGLMLFKLLKRCGVEKVVLAGFDGFESNIKANYYNKELINNVEVEQLEIKTIKIKEQIELLRKVMNIEFLTKSQYERK